MAVNTKPNNSSLSHDELIDFISKSYILKPKDIIIGEIKWKYLVRSAIAGKNIMMTGPAGCGKTMIAFALAKALNRKMKVFNLGQTQDPKSFLIGNTHASKEKGTYFNQSTFVKAIQEMDTIIVLDELTRAHPEAWNLLIPVIDYNQRYLRLDEEENSIDIQVAKGVSFISTANIGSEYTATRVLDRALTDRFAIVEVDILTKDQEFGLLRTKFPKLSDDIAMSIAMFAHDTRVEILKPSPKISGMVSTRMSIETAELCMDGFSLLEAAEAMIFPHYPIEGSERNVVKAMLQQHIKIPITKGSKNPLFDATDMSKVV
jgi:nitric oxide reductase NorQ protein